MILAIVLGLIIVVQVCQLVLTVRDDRDIKRMRADNDLAEAQLHKEIEVYLTSKGRTEKRLLS